MAMLASQIERRAFLSRMAWWRSKSSSSSSSSGSLPAHAWSQTDDASDSEAESSSSSPIARAINQVYVDYRFKQLAPSWLPLCPESSFFMPTTPPLTKIIEQQHKHRPAAVMSVEEIKFVINPLGWVSVDAITEIEYYTAQEAKPQIEDGSSKANESNNDHNE